MEQATDNYTKDNVRSCLLALVLILASAAAAIFGRCAKAEQGQPDMTGQWCRDDSDVTYSFFDDSRFQQSDRPGEQWIWKQGAGRVDLLGNPQRLWLVAFDGPNEVRVIESDTFTIYRQ